MRRLALLLALAGGPAAAGVARLSPDADAMSACLSDAVSLCHGGSEDAEAQVSCLNGTLAALETALTELEAAIVADVSADVPALGDLMSTERAAWQGWRDALCNRRAAMDFAVPGGSWQADCAMRMTANRWHRLQALPQGSDAWP